MKKKYLIILSVIIMLGALVWFREPVLKAAGGAFALNNYASNSNTANLNGVVATGTLNYFPTPGTGTTTVTMYTGGTDQIDLDVFLIASTTATTDLRWTVEFSNSTTSVAANRIWFPLTENLQINATTTFITQLAKEFGWRPALDARHAIATSTSADGTFELLTASTRITLKDVAARWTRVVFYAPTPGTSLNESTALGVIPAATSTAFAIQVFPGQKDPL